MQTFKTTEGYQIHLEIMVTLDLRYSIEAEMYDGTGTDTTRKIYSYEIGNEKSVCFASYCY